MRGDQLARQWKILKLLETRKDGLTVPEISAELEVPTRTVYRDLTALQSAGFSFETDCEDKKSYWKLAGGFRTDLPLPVTATELMSLHMSRDLFRVFQGTVFQESIESLFAKVRASLPPQSHEYLDHVSGSLSVGFGPPKDLRVLKEVIATVSDATAHRKRIEITYSALSTGGITTRIVDPYQVWAMTGCFYLIGRCHLREAVRTFAMDRIKDVAVLDQSFDYPAGFSLGEYLQTAFRVMTGPPDVVKVWFAPGAAKVVRERIWHPSQEIRDQPDGSIIVTMEVAINYEILSWILGFGCKADVVAPESLRARVRQELEASLGRYSTDTG